MPTLVLRFLVNLTSRATAGPFGVQFHRWLPDGEADSIALPTEEPDILVNVWFERCGYVDGNFVRYDWRRREIDPEIMRRQHRLEGGDLRGKVTIQNLPGDLPAVLREDRFGDTLYMQLGKRVVTRGIYPSVSTFLRILQSHLGQYWLPELHPWDSTRVSLGAYCSSLGLRWSLDEGQTWAPFHPNELVFHAGAIGGPLSDYIGEVDWSELRSVVASGFSPSPAAELLGRAHGSVDEQEWRSALIDSVSALELALSDFAGRAVGYDAGLLERLAPFRDQRQLPTKLTVAAAFSGKVNLADLPAALSAIQRRNEVVHDGWNPNKESKQLQAHVKSDVEALLRVTATFIHGPRFRFPKQSSSTNYSTPAP